MTNNQTFTTLAGFFQAIWNLGNQILIYDGAFQVTLNQFIMGIAIMLIVLTALLNFVRIGTTRVSNIHVSDIKNKFKDKDDE